MSKSHKRTLLDLATSQEKESTSEKSPVCPESATDSIKASSRSSGPAGSHSRKSSAELLQASFKNKFKRKRGSVEKKSPTSSHESLANGDSVLAAQPAATCANGRESMPGVTDKSEDIAGEDQELIEFIRGNVDLDSDQTSNSNADFRQTPDESERSKTPNSLSDSNLNSSTKKLSSHAKRPSGWFNNMISPTYKQRTDEFHRNFKDVPADERLIVDYSCALQKNILVHGRLYISQNWICFYSNIFTVETTLTIRCKDVKAVTKEKTARVIPNAIQVMTSTEKYFFSSFGSRDKAYLLLFRIWQNSQLENPMSPQQLWSWVHASYGEELGLTASDDDYVPPTPDSCNSQSDLHERSIAKKDEKEKAESSYLNGTLLNVDSVSVEAASIDDLNGNGLTKRAAATSTSALDDKCSNLHTDSGDTTEDSETEITCSGHEHAGNKSIDMELNIQVDALFELFFSDSQFLRDFYKERKTTDVVMSPWQDGQDGEHKHRTVSYTLALNASFGPKTTPATEKQTCRSESKQGSCYFVHVECVNDPALPYGENFYTLNKFCMTRISAHRTRLKIYSEIIFVKSVWGLTKSIIDRNVNNGISQHFRAINNKLKRLSDSNVQVRMGDEHSQKKKVRRRRKRNSSTERSAAVLKPISSSQTKSSETDNSLVYYGMSGDAVVRLMCIFLMALVLMNMLLFYKLWSLESLAVYSSSHIDSLRIGETRSQEDWISILEKQQVLHASEVNQWKDILETTVQLLEQMKMTLVNLKEQVDKRRELFS